MARGRRKDYQRKIRKKPCTLTQAGISEIDYRDIELLKQFITDKGKIIPRRISGLSARKQKLLTRAIKRARNAALLSFSEGYIPQQQEQVVKPVEVVRTQEDTAATTEEN